MNTTENARRNHDALFPGRRSELSDTDPEFVALFDNWAFDEVVGRTQLDPKTRVLLILGATIASQAPAEFRVMLRAGLQVGLTPIEIKEAVYQAVPYAGIAKALEFLHATNEEFRAKGIPLPLEGQATTEPGTRFARGASVQRAIFGDAIEAMRQKAPGDQAHIHEFLASNCFGDHYTRGGLDLKSRELLTFAMLVALGGCDSQVRSHVTGNIRIGNDRLRLIDTLTQLLPYIGYPRTLNGLRAIDEMAPA